MTCYCRFRRVSGKGFRPVGKKVLLLGAAAALVFLSWRPAASAGVIGWWRFEGTPGQSISSVPNEANPVHPDPLDGSPGSSAVYSGLRPGVWIYDPLTGNVYSNTASLDMGGSNRSVTVTNNSLLNASSFTIEVFFRIGADQNSYPSYVSRRESASKGWQLDIDNVEGARCRFDTTASSGQTVPANAADRYRLTPGQWYHTAVTFDGTTITHYTNYGNMFTRTLTGNSSDVTNLTANLVLGVWAGPSGTAIDEVRFHDEVLTPDKFLRAFPEPLSSLTNPQQGLSAHIVRVNSDLSYMWQTIQGLTTLQPGNPDHSVSQVRVLSAADIDLGGNYTNSVGVLAGDQHSSGANPEDYAIRLAGYIYAPSDNYQRTFAFSADDGWEFRIGEMAVGSGTGTTVSLVPLTFPKAGYYPFDIFYRNRDGSALLEVSSAPGLVPSWNSTYFKILGTDDNFPVYQRPEAMPANWGPNPAGPASYTGPVDPAKADGLRVSIFNRGSSSASIHDAMVYAWANTPSTTTKSDIIDYYDPQNGSQGSFTGSFDWPHNTTGDDNNFISRASGAIYFSQPGDYAFAVGTDDGFRLRVGNQVLGIFAGGRGHPSSTANVGYVRIQQPGLYPFEFFHYENSGSSSAEISVKKTGDLIFPSSRDPAVNGFERDLNNNQAGVKVFATTPKVAWQRVGNDLQARAYVEVDALGIAIPPEQWILHQVVQNGQARTQGLKGYYYQFTGSDQTWDSSPTLVGTRDDLQSGLFSFGDNYAYGTWGNLENQFGVRWIGYLNVPVTGIYHFRMYSTERSWIYIDLNGDGVLESAPTQDVRDNYWYDVNLTQGLHAVEFRARDFTTSYDYARLYWMMPGETNWSYVPASVFSQNIYDGALVPVTYALNDMLGSPDWWEVVQSFPLGTEGTYRLSAFYAGEWAVLQETFQFVPEPATVTLLLLGAVGLGFLGVRRWRQR